MKSKVDISDGYLKYPDIIDEVSPMIFCLDNLFVILGVIVPFGGFLVNGDGYCNKASFECDGHKCIPQQQWCDGIANCADGKDEKSDCGK